MNKARFKLVSDFIPSGDQPAAIANLVEGERLGKQHQTLLGVTGSGKTFTIAHVIASSLRPALIIAHNKTLAAQLYSEFKQFFPANKVEYFVSYYDYYQPEAYIPSKDIYIEKDASINDQLDKLRHSATMSLFEHQDVIIVSSVSCIYGLGTPELYKEMRISIEKGMKLERDQFLRKLVDIQYERNNIDFKRGTFRVNGDLVEIIPVYDSDSSIRIEFFDDEIEDIKLVDSLTGRPFGTIEKVNIYPATHYAVSAKLLKRAIKDVKLELSSQIKKFKRANKLIEAQRIEERTMNDIAMLEATNYCKGIENYSRYLYSRVAGAPPPTLLEYLPKDTLVIIDESHQTIPQIGAMYKGDRSRKESLIEHGFRLPSALDNRPLSFGEFESIISSTRIYVSATPSRYELEISDGLSAEQVIRPTGLVDPAVEIRPVKNQVDDLLGEINERIEKGERILVSALTKRQAEDLADYLQSLKIKAAYLHSDIVTLDRIAILQDLRIGKFDVLIGVNLLREGLDIPEVSRVAILNGDVEGFLRSATSLIQTSGRAARNINGKVIIYADRITDSINVATREMNRRRKKQEAYNKKYKIKPATVKRNMTDPLVTLSDKDYIDIPADKFALEYSSQDEIGRLINLKEKKMLAAAKEFEFEKAAKLRDELKKLQELLLTVG
ncbi:MAG: excinuclease ABC subunit UvrB [Nitrospinota bacterium]